MAIRKDGHVIRNQPVETGWDVINNPTKEQLQEAIDKVTEPEPEEPTYSEIQKAVQEALEQPDEPEEPEEPAHEEPPAHEDTEEIPTHEDTTPPIVYAPISETGKAFICVSDELKEHYEQIIRTRDNILNDPEASGGEQAAIINATTTALKELLKMQKEAYNADMLAKIQAATVKSLEAAPIQTKKDVLQAIKEHLDEIS